MSWWSDTTSSVENAFGFGSTPDFSVTPTTIDDTDLLNQLTANYNIELGNQSAAISSGIQSAPSNNPLMSQYEAQNQIAFEAQKANQNYANQYAETAYDTQKYNASATQAAAEFNQKMKEQEYATKEGNLSGLIRTGGTIAAVSMLPAETAPAAATALISTIYDKNVVSSAIDQSSEEDLADIGTSDQSSQQDAAQPADYLATKPGNYLENLEDNLGDSYLYTYKPGGLGASSDFANDPFNLKAGPMVEGLASDPKNNPLGASMVTQGKSGAPEIHIPSAVSSLLAMSGHFKKRLDEQQSLLDQITKQKPATTPVGAAEQDAANQSKIATLQQKQNSESTSAILGGLSDAQKQQQLAAQQTQDALATQQLRMQTLQQKYPATSYSTIQGNMSATQRVVSSLGMLFGSAGSSYLGPQNPATELYYKNLDSMIAENKMGYDRELQSINTQFEGTIKGIQLKGQAATDAANMLTASSQVINQNFSQFAQTTKDLSQSRKAIIDAMTTQQTLNNQIAKYKSDAQKSSVDNFSAYTKGLSDLNMVTVPLYDENGTRKMTSDGKGQMTEQRVAISSDAAKQLQTQLPKISGTLSDIDSVNKFLDLKGTNKVLDKNGRNTSIRANLTNSEAASFNAQVSQILLDAGYSAASVKTATDALPDTNGFGDEYIAAARNLLDTAKKRLLQTQDTLVQSSTQSPDRSQKVINSANSLLNGI